MGEHLHLISARGGVAELDAATQGREGRSDLSSPEAWLTARDALVGMRVSARERDPGTAQGLGVMFGKRIAGFMRRPERFIAGGALRCARAAADLRGAGRAARRATWNGSASSTGSCMRPSKSRIVRLLMNRAGHSAR